MRDAKWLMVIVGLTSLLATAQVPNRITFNARMTDDVGAPVTGSHSVFFSLYAADTGGTAVWTEAWPTLSFSSGGVAFAELGTTTPLTPTVLDGTKLYLELTIDGTVMSPRLGIVSVPYAIRAGDAQTLGGIPASGFAPATHAHSYLPVGAMLSCPGNQKVSAISVNGNVTCSVDEFISYTPGEGLALNGTTFSVVFGGSGSATTPGAL